MQTLYPHPSHYPLLAQLAWAWCLYLYFHCFRQSDCLASWVCGLVSTRSTRDTQQSLLASASPKTATLPVSAQARAPVTSVSVMWPREVACAPGPSVPAAEASSENSSLVELSRQTLPGRGLGEIRGSAGNSASPRPFLLSILCPTATDFYKIEWFFHWWTQVQEAGVHLLKTSHR